MSELRLGPEPYFPEPLIRASAAGRVAPLVVERRERRERRDMRERRDLRERHDLSERRESCSTAAGSLISKLAVPAVT
jgi:hypothetical protein